MATQVRKKPKPTPTAKKAPSRAKKTAPPAEDVPPPAPAAPRRIVFIDVENTSSEGELVRVLDELQIDLTSGTTELAAIGNWRVVGQHLGRSLAERGASLVHSAPAARVSDWSDLWIAVHAGIWLGRSRPGDRLDIVSHDRAFDAVGDAAARLGVGFRRITYRPSGARGAVADATDDRAGASSSRGRRRGPGGRRKGRGDGSHARPPAPRSPTQHPAEVPATTWAAEPAPGEIPADESRADRDVPHGASPAQLREAIARLAASDRSHTVTLDALSVVLKEAGFQRPPNSPRLVTRLRATPGVVVLPNGNVRLAGELIEGATPEEGAGRHQGRRGGRRRGGRGRKAPVSPST